MYGTTIEKSSHEKGKIASQQPKPLWFRKSNFEWTWLASKECTILLEFNNIQIHGIETSTFLQSCPLKKNFYKIHYNPTKFLCIIWPCAKNNDERSASGQIIIFLLEHRRICTDFGPIINEDKGMFFWDTLYVMDVDILCLGSEVFATRLTICNKMLNHCQILLTMQYGGLHVIVA